MPSDGESPGNSEGRRRSAGWRRLGRIRFGDDFWGTEVNRCLFRCEVENSTNDWGDCRFEFAIELLI